MEKELKIALVGFGHRGEFLFNFATKVLKGNKGIAICDINQANHRHHSEF